MGKKKDFVPDPNYNPYRVRGSPPPQQRPSSQAHVPAPAQSRQFIDFNTQRVCPSCGKIINIEYNFCKYCGYLFCVR